MPSRKQIIVICAVAALLITIIVAIAVIVFKAQRNASEARRRAVPFTEREPIMITLIEILSIAASISNTKPFLVYGTLLGYVRNKDLICYDFDVDVGIKSDAYNSLYEAVNVVINNYPDYKIRSKSFLQWKQFEVVHRETGINADVFEYIQEDKKYHRNVPSWYSKYFLHEKKISYPLDWIDELRQVEFKGHAMYIPNQPDKLLQTYYGPNYLIPDHKCNASCSECVKI